MSEEIKIGEAVLDYIAELGIIEEEIQEAYTYAAKCLLNLSDGAYRGMAKDEIELFFSSLESHLQRLVLLYQAASTYISNAYKTMYYNEEQLADWIIEQMGGEQITWIQN